MQMALSIFLHNFREKEKYVNHIGLGSDINFGENAVMLLSFKEGGEAINVLCGKKFLPQ